MWFHRYNHPTFRQFTMPVRNQRICVFSIHFQAFLIEVMCGSRKYAYPPPPGMVFTLESPSLGISIPGGMCFEDPPPPGTDFLLFFHLNQQPLQIPNFIMLEKINVTLVLHTLLLSSYKLYKNFVLYCNIVIVIISSEKCHYH